MSELQTQPQAQPATASKGGSSNADTLSESIDGVASETALEGQSTLAATAETTGSEAPVQESPLLAQTPLPLGQQLANRRVQLGYSLEFVGNHLKLSPRKIQQLEAGDWSAFPSGPFLSGFIRNYARLLQLNGAEIVALLPASSSGQRTEAAEIFQGSTFRPAAGHMPQPYGQPFWRKSSFFAVLLLLVLVALTLLLPDDVGHRLREWSAELGRVESAAQQPVLVPVPLDTKLNQEAKPELAPAGEPLATEVKNTAEKTNSVVEAGSAVSTSPVAAVTPAIKSTIETAPKIAVASAVAITSELRMKFQGASWVEVKQKDGSIVSSQLNAPNTEKVVSGIAPLVLTIGNASSVQLQYKGKAIDLKPYTRDDVAHVTLD